ncbi:type II secretion system minor pseudopilin GspK [Oceanococcus atlanticus]|uniref:type II secretion system minor pseudopilin GspK n=1 Tax=Oceanococcus atlanticus TaxID=1317117 RepID=UPI0009FA98C3|nr:type II secretion system minor pseudopilin GspK [Oceanococcus atlanticus]
MRAQRGVALITAVMVVAFASTVAAALMVSQNLAVHRSANMIHQDQAWWYLVGMEQWAGTLLDRDLEDNQFDYLGEAWAQPVDFLPVDEGALSGRLVDLQGRFNLLSVVSGDGVVVEPRKQQLIRLLQNVEGLKSGTAEELAIAIVDWMDQDTEPGFPSGAEDSLYLSKDRPYRTPNRPMASVSELLLVNGVTPKIYAALQPHVTVHPGDHKINVNTATAPVLMSLNENMNPGVVEGLMNKREEVPWETDEQFITDELIAGISMTTEDITVKTHYFQAEAAAMIGNVRLSYVSLLERLEGARTRPIAHSRNTL